MSYEKRREVILERVRKLRALGTSSNPHEAETARNQARALMEKWGISEGETDVAVGEHPVPGFDFASTWRFGLLTAVARRYGCRTIRYHGPRPLAAMIIGPAENATMIEFVFRKLEGDVTRLCNRDMEVGLVRLKKEIYEESVGLLGEEKAVARANAWSGKWIKRYGQDVEESFCLGATLALQDRILFLEEDIPVSYSDLMVSGKAPASTAPASMAPASTVAASTAAPASAVSGPVESPAIMESDKAVNAVNHYLKNRRHNMSSGHIDVHVSDRRAYDRGNRVGYRIKMPGTERTSTAETMSTAETSTTTTLPTTQPMTPPTTSSTDTPSEATASVSSD